MIILRRVGLLAVAIILTFLFIPSYVCLAQEAAISVNGGNTIVLEPANQIRVSLDIDNIPSPGVGAFTINLSYDNSVINVTDINANEIDFAIGYGFGGGSAIVYGSGLTPITSDEVVAYLDIKAVGENGSSTTFDISVSQFVDLENNPLSYTEVDTPVQIQILIPEQYTLTIYTNGNGSTLGAGTFDEFRIRWIFAKPDDGWKFVNWTGDIDTIVDPNAFQTQITMLADYIITANFIPIPEYSLAIDKLGNGSVSGAGTYTEGTEARISAYPDHGWVFVNWSGDTDTIADVNDSTTTIIIDDNYTITANFTQLPEYSLTLGNDGNGTTTADPLPPYYKGDTVQITATPNEGYAFTSWSGDILFVDNVTASTTNVTMNGNYVITANFHEVQSFTLTIAVNGSGSTTPTAGEHQYEEGEVAAITASPSAGWEFVYWTGDVTNPDSASTSVIMNADKAITANFSQIGVTTYTLTIEINGSGSTTPAAGSYPYPEGTVVNISATPNEGWQFNGWSGDVANTNSASTTITMDADKTISASFIEEEAVVYTLTINVNGNGSTNPIIGTKQYEEGKVVTISAAPRIGWQFDGWSGDVANTNSASTTITMDADKTVTANFSQKQDVIPPSVPVVIVTNIEKTEADIFWITNEPCDSQVEYWTSPSQLSPLDSTLVTWHRVHLSDLEPATIYHYKVMSKDKANNLTVSGEYTFTTAGTAYTFITSDWDTSIEELDTRTELTIGFRVMNIGDTAGNCQVNLRINGEVEETKNIYLDAGESQEVTFNSLKSTNGTYQIDIDETTTSFEIAYPESATASTEPTSESTNWWFIASIVTNTLLLLILTSIFVKWYEHRNKYVSS